MSTRSLFAFQTFIFLRHCHDSSSHLSSSVSRSLSLSDSMLSHYAPLNNPSIRQRMTDKILCRSHNMKKCTHSSSRALHNTPLVSDDQLDTVPLHKILQFSFFFAFVHVKTKFFRVSESSVFLGKIQNIHLDKITNVFLLLGFCILLFTYVTCTS